MFLHQFSRELLLEPLLHPKPAACEVVQVCMLLFCELRQLLPGGKMTGFRWIEQGYSHNQSNQITKYNVLGFGWSIPWNFASKILSIANNSARKQSRNSEIWRISDNFVQTRLHGGPFHVCHCSLSRCGENFTKNLFALNRSSSILVLDPGTHQSLVRISWGNPAGEVNII